ncbi:MAG: phosphoserine transaminase [Pseudomonadota bacterium]
MSELARPVARPANPRFSSGPCIKRPGWSPHIFERYADSLGRSHRASPAKDLLREAIDRTHALLELPHGYRVGIMPASDTGAFEAAMWSLLGARGADVLAWESFGKGWVTDIVKQLRLEEVRVLEADYGALPDLSRVDFDRDVVFTWNGTTSGVRVPDGNWIADDRTGLTLCDATSAAFAQDIDWAKIDCATFSWQKVLGGEAQHGVIVLSPRAVERLVTYSPPWPLPKLFRLTKGGALIDGVFTGATINTPSMLCVADYLDALRWAEDIGGRTALQARADESAGQLAAWVASRDWVDHLAAAPETRSNTSVCLKIVDHDIVSIAPETQSAFCKSMVSLLAEENVALDIGSYRDAPPGLRIWCGSTVEPSDIAALLPWLDWAFASVRAQHFPH